jgi:hypothetical protein
MSVPYYIKKFNSETKQVTVSLRDVMGNQHDLTVSADGLSNHEMGIGYIQDNFKELTPAQRELFITGIPEGMWNDIFNEEKE